MQGLPHILSNPNGYMVPGGEKVVFGLAHISWWVYRLVCAKIGFRLTFFFNILFMLISLWVHTLLFIFLQ